MISTLGAGEIAWIAIAVTLAVSLVWQVRTQQQLRQLKKRVDRNSRSIGFMDEWADDVSTRVAVLEAAADVVNDNQGHENSPLRTTMPFLQSKLGRASNVTSDRARTIIYSSRKFISDE